jgi:hypothetical protein
MTWVAWELEQAVCGWGRFCLRRHKQQKREPHFKKAAFPHAKEMLLVKTYLFIT